MGFAPSIPVAFGMLLVNMIGWGSWINTLKKCGNWRFEAYYWDFAWSIVVWTVLLSILLGGFDLNNFSLIGGLWAILGGFFWGLGNILLVAAIALTGFANAFPLALGIALILGTTLAFITNPTATSNPVYLFAGLFMVLLAVIANGIAYKLKERGGIEKRNLQRGIIVSLLCGLILGLFPFPFNYAFAQGLSGYSGAVFMTIGGFLATVVLLPLIMKKPLVPKQPPIDVDEYLRAQPSWHGWAILAGLIWSMATVSNLVVASMPNFSVAIAYTLGQCAPMIGALWGIFAWKEFRGAPKKSYAYLGLMFTLFIFGIFLLSKSIG
ncbi:MAG TPA: L-rhamnose/proton symporter RhaT [Patescibacteria group bacterium]|nr:L-rhamnose/proton symporter RhaT [Patescibacteria group bacterium]